MRLTAPTQSIHCAPNSGRDFVNFQGARIGCGGPTALLSTSVYELDQPRVLEFKRDRVSRPGRESTAEGREVAIDLRADRPAARQAHGFDATQPWAWIAEVLLIYLPQQASQSACADHGCPATCVSPGDLFRGRIAKRT